MSEQNQTAGSGGKISLCMIVGNVENYIHRCLKSFLPIADEVCIVRAIGSQESDRTMEIAIELLNSRNIPHKIANYINAPAHDWPHVDNFAAARQMSFDMATHDYCFWCDSDDILESGAEVVRELAARGGYASYIFPYKIAGRDVIIPRDRLMLKSAGKWNYPVHECFDYHIQPVQAVQDERVVITHLPDVSKKNGGNPRNLRILKSIPENQQTPGLLYHLAGELKGAGDIAGMVRVATKAIQSPDLGKPERYDMFIMMADSDENPNTIENFLHLAYKTDPQRREALYLLAHNALNYGNPPLALSYARQMMATHRPELKDWNERAACYGFAGAEMMERCLRANGYFMDAELLRRQTLADAGGPRIALLHATRGRARQASLAKKTWTMFAARPEQVEHIFAFDDDDAESQKLDCMHHIRVKAGGGCVAAWNNALFSTAAPVVVQMSDDWLPPLHWDELILQRIGDVNKPAVLAVSDGARTDKLLCMAIATRVYLAQDGFLFHPWFTGVYSDNWFTDEAYRRGAVIEARDLVFHHQHPAFSKEVKPDQTYAEQNAPQRYAEGRMVYDVLQRRNDWSTVPGFFNYWTFYRRVAELLPDGADCAEVGVWLGRSIIYLAQELKRLGKTRCKLYAVDHFKGESNQREHEATVLECGGSLRPTFEANLNRCGVADMITIVEGESAAVGTTWQPEHLDFCYIDAAHDYASVCHDLAGWRDKVKPGGILAGHDADCGDVLKAVQETFPSAQVNGSVWMVKIPEKP